MKLKNEYKLKDMPEPFFTTIDIIEVGDLSETQAFELIKYLKQIGAGEIYTQVDGMAEDSPDCLYSRGLHLVNRTGVYAFCFRGV